MDPTTICQIFGCTWAGASAGSAVMNAYNGWQANEIKREELAMKATADETQKKLDEKNKENTKLTRENLRLQDANQILRDEVERYKAAARAFEKAAARHGGGDDGNDDEDDDEDDGGGSGGAGGASRGGIGPRRAGNGTSSGRGGRVEHTASHIEHRRTQGMTGGGIAKKGIQHHGAGNSSSVAMTTAFAPMVENVMQPRARMAHAQAGVDDQFEQITAGVQSISLASENIF